MTGQHARAWKAGWWILGALASLSPSFREAEAEDGGISVQPTPGSVALPANGSDEPQPEQDSAWQRPLKVEILAPSSASQKPLLVFRGNLLFSEYVYRSFLQLPQEARATPEEARSIADKLRTFLRSGGYDLAVVT